MWGMEKTLTIRVSEEDLRLWKDAAWGARVSLSEWVRRRCDDGLVRPPGDPEPPETRDSRTDAVSVTPPPAVLTTSDGLTSQSGKRSFRPDPKGGSAK